MNQPTNYFYEDIFNNSYDPLLLIEGERFIDCNKATIKCLGLKSKEEIFNIHPSQISPEFQPDGRSSEEKANDMIKKAFENGTNRFEWLHQDLKGNLFWVEVTLMLINKGNKEILYTMWHDITEKKETETKLITSNENLNKMLLTKEKDLIRQSTILTEYKRALDAGCIISKTNIDGIITYVNDLFIKAYGFTKEELIGKPHNIIKHPDTKQEKFIDLWTTILDKRIWQGVVKNKTKNGSFNIVQTTIVPILDVNKNISEFIAIRTDVTDIFKQRLTIQEQNIDKLTNLLNRQKLIQDIHKAKYPLLSLINIDRFRDINDSYGHEIGDKLLINIGQKLKEILPPYIKVYRLHGDEFAILHDGEKNIDSFILTSKNIVTFFERTLFQIDGYSLDLVTRIGVSYSHPNTLINAELALTQAEEENKNIMFFDKSFNYAHKMENSILWTRKIRDAFEHNLFETFTQEIFPLKNELPNKCECLIRMRDKNTNQIISPYLFLQQAKRARLYSKITEFIINDSFSIMKNLTCGFSINLTIQDINNINTKELIYQKVMEFEDKSRITFEIVESEGIENLQDVRDFVDFVKKLGCNVAIDDFGTGYSNFEYLTKLNVDFIKVDGSLIKNIHKDEQLRDLVAVIVKFAKTLNIKTVAEFVHNEEVFNIVKQLDFDYAQGYFIAEPQPITICKNGCLKLL